jgi:hypothetical protein
MLTRGCVAAILLTVLLAVLLPGWPDAAVGAGPTVGATAGDDFRRTVAPFLETHCTACHGGDLVEGDLRLDVIEPGRAATADRGLWTAALERLSLGTMPPEGEPRPDREDVEHVIGWIRRTLDVPSTTPNAAELPGFGNYVDHCLLFTEPPVRKAASPARLWRISPYIFREAANEVSRRPLLVVKKNQGGEGLHPAFPFLTPAHSFRDLSLPHGFEEATTELLVDMAWLVAGHQLEPRRLPADLRFALEDDHPTRGYGRAVRFQYGLVLQRDPEPEELRRLVELARRTEPEAGRREAVQTVLAAVLVMPEAVFRVEAGAGTPDEHGRVLLTPRETAFAISYALTDRPPDAALRAAVTGGRLATPADARREVERLLDDESVEKPRILRFFREYFEYTRATEIFKDGRIRKHYMPEQLVEDADALVLAALKEDRDVLRRLLTTPEYFVNYGPGGRIGVNRPDRRQKWYYELFNLPREWQWQAEQPVRLPTPRAGLLTHPAWLISFSDNEKNQAIQRGRWVRTKLLGGTVPDVPIGVDAQLPADPSLTLREKMHVTRAEYCWRCHQKMDPLGLPFEQFDDFGIHRTEELGRPVDATGIIECGVAELDGPVQDPFEYVERLASSRHVAQVFVRHAFRYWMGRNETPDDAPTLIDAERAYTESGGSMQALIASLLSSDSFLYRRLPAPRTALDGTSPDPSPPDTP